MLERWKRAKAYNSRPDPLSVVFVLESPPQSEKYFYDTEGKTTEPLFSAMMKVIKYPPKDKLTGLIKFKNLGFIIVDTCYKPVNHLGRSQRKKMLLSCEGSLVKDLQGLIQNKKTPLILVKVNICRLLETRLKDRGFNIINNGVEVPFPSNGWQKEFQKKIVQLLK